MTPRLKTASIMLLVAMLLSLVPAAVTASPASAATCDWAQFVADVTVPDGMRFDPGATFTKTWRLRNIGTCTWTTGYTMAYDSGEKMGTTTSVALPNSVAPGQTVDVSVNMTAPSTAGHYIGYWKFKNASGTSFGIGYNALKAWWVEINVTGSTTTGTAYDFTANASSATWSSGAGGLSFPGTEGDAKGFALKLDKPNFESGVTASQPGMLFSPQQITNGFIQAEYPDFTVQSGDRFQATVGCQAGATSCYVAYRLDYKVGSTIRTFWTFREKFEGWTYNANLDLSPLAGQTVKFILYISAYGSPVGDRALWGNPIIARKGVTTTPTPTATGTPQTATPTPTGTVTVPPSACDKAQFIADVNYPDGTVVAPGATFTKTWRLKNVGQCPWTTSYQLVFFSGQQMSAPSSLAFTQNVAVGQTFDFSVNMTAPASAGTYRGYWMFKNANGALFGIGALGNKPWWVEIKVSGPTATPGGPTNTPTPTATGPTPTPTATGSNVAYDFAKNACQAKWVSRAASSLPCPGTDGDTAKGFVLTPSTSKLETGAIDPRPGLITYPSPVQGLQDGYIQGFYPAFKVQRGDRFRSTINCEGGATLCYVAFRVDYQTGTDPIRTIFGPFVEKVDTPKPLFFNVDVDLSALAGKDVKFILTVLSAGTANGDRALWVGPHIYRPGSTTGTATPTPTSSGSATSTPTPTTSAATTYQNTKYNFKFTLPAGSSIVQQSDNFGRVNLPIVTAGTNLQEKYIEVSVTEGKTDCAATGFENPGPKTTVTINNLQFTKQSGQGVALSNIYDWTAYSTLRNNACIIMLFVLHSVNPGVYNPPPPVFDKAKETAVIDTVMNTFNLISYP